MAIFRKKSNATPMVEAPEMPRVAWDISRLILRVSSAAPTLEASEVDAALLHARLADHYRDVGLSPPDIAEFGRDLSRLDVESLRRMALAVATLDDPELRSVLVELAPLVPISDQIERGFLELARDTAPLTVALVRQSAIRAEEFARHFSMRLGIAILRETSEKSQQRLNALDYRRLLLEAEQAKQAAQDKMERLREKQKQSDRQRRRGKW